jgi:hypothetical protein
LRESGALVEKPVVVKATKKTQTTLGKRKKRTDETAEFVDSIEQQMEEFANEA